MNEIRKKLEGLYHNDPAADGYVLYFDDVDAILDIIIASIPTHVMVINDEDMGYNQALDEVRVILTAAKEGK